jgi:hypothetical protein
MKYNRIWQGILNAWEKSNKKTKKTLNRWLSEQKSIEMREDKISSLNLGEIFFVYLTS